MTSSSTAETRTERLQLTGTPVTVIAASGAGGLLRYAQELFRYRDLLFFLIRRDIKVRYAQTILGFGWAVLQPFTQMVVFSIFFGALAGIASGGVPYPVFSIAGVVPWTYFSNAVLAAATSLMGSVGIVSKVYFPRLLIPFAPVGAGLVDLAIGLGLLLAVMAAYGMAPPAEVLLYLPILVVAATVAAAAFAVWLSVLGVQFRDVRYISPFFLQIMLFVTPVIYVVSEVPESARPFYALNPMVGVVSGFRAAFLDIAPMPWQTIATSLAVSSAALFVGILYFRRVERVFADIA